ncbi:ef hand family protein [Stylonychia lemnae]|uniref:Ef hand family protein n=1 Tax=Stylonychia lemnae TaxID=5949 RepID=A0A077ZQS4_STYLE|nr:ef hand family protein [Stylonychia lemnae]|eukprot:CDW72278.1 ef hand family protein [Stylonychia lemnae]
MKNSFQNLRAKKTTNNSANYSNLTSRGQNNYQNLSYRDTQQKSSNLSSRSKGELGQGQNNLAAEQKRILDQHINYFSKDTYYKIKEDLMSQEPNQQIVEIFKDYQSHHGTDDNYLMNDSKSFDQSQSNKKRLKSHVPIQVKQSPEMGQQEQKVNQTFDRNRYPGGRGNSSYAGGEGDRAQQNNINNNTQSSSRSIETLRKSLPFQRIERPIQKIVNHQRRDSQQNSAELRKNKLAQNDLTFEEIRDILKLQRYQQSAQEQRYIIEQMLPYVWYAPINSVAFQDLIMRYFQSEIDMIDSQYIPEELIFSLFKLFDTNQDYLIDKHELEVGFQILLNGNGSKSSPDSKQVSRVNYVSVSDIQNNNQRDFSRLFDEIDQEGKERIFLRDLEKFLKPHIQRMQTKNIKQSKDHIQNDAIVHNLALEIFKRCNISKNGIIIKQEMRIWILKDKGQSFAILQDLLEGRQDYFEEYQDILFRNIQSPYDNDYADLNDRETSPQVYKYQNTTEQDEKLRLSELKQSQKYQLKPKIKEELKSQGFVVQDQDYHSNHSTKQREKLDEPNQSSTDTTISFKKPRPPPRDQRLADCSGFSSSLLQNKIDQKLEAQPEQKPNQSDDNPAPSYDKVFETNEYQSVEEKIKLLSIDSGLKRINAFAFAKQIKKQLELYDESDGMSFEEFKSILEPQLRKVAKSTFEKKGFDNILKQIFDIFDDNKNGTVDQKEMSNCMALMCGGTVQDKIHAAFILFDFNGSNTLSYDELITFLGTVFKIFDCLMSNKQNMYKLTQETADKCFKDLGLVSTQEIQFEIFLEWLLKKPIQSSEPIPQQTKSQNIKGSQPIKQIPQKQETKPVLQQESQKQNLIKNQINDPKVNAKATTNKIQESEQPQKTQVPEPTQQQLIQSQQIPKSEIKERIRKQTLEYVDKFLQMQRYVELMKELRTQSQLANVRINDVIKAFDKHKVSQQINKQVFFDTMRNLITIANPSIDKNQTQQMDEQLRKLYSQLDQDKNGILDLVEILSALSLLCKGSIPQKMSCLQQAFFKQENQGQDQQISFKELKKYLLCIFKISLETKNEILFDFDLEKLAENSAKDCFEYNLEDDFDQGTLNVDAVLRWLNKKGGKIY